MARSSLFDNTDRALGGKLAELLTEWRADGLTLAEIAWELREREITVSHETVRAWLTRIEDAPAPAGDPA